MMEQMDSLTSEVGFSADSSQYLTFSLGGEEYGVDILKVQEIKGYAPATPVPNTPGYIKGVMNLRGTIIPVLDLRRKLQMEEAEYNQFTVIIVVKVATKVVGLVVDSVSDVLNISKTAVQDTPEMGGHVDVRFISGMAKVNEKLVMLLDIDKVLGDEGLESLTKND